MEKNSKNISYFDAQQTINKLRYQPRSEWTKKQREEFKVCNFNVLSRKRLNKILSQIKSFGKLGDKSHYKFFEEDIRLIKDLILQNLEDSFKKFFKDIEIIKEEDLKKIQDHFEKQEQESSRLRAEIEEYKIELQMYKKEYISVEKETLKKILGKKDFNQKIKNKKKGGDINLDSKKNLKNAITDWKDGMTINEIKNEFLKKNLNLINTKKKKIKL